VQTIGQDSYVVSANQDLALLLVTPNAYSVPTCTYCCLFHLPWPGLLCSPPAAHLQAHSCSLNHQWASFYGNIVTVNCAIFLSQSIVQSSSQTNILRVFIAWLNMDLGIETCFFDGMDAYTKTWLQFIFPLYVLSLVGLIIIAND